MRRLTFWATQLSVKESKKSKRTNERLKFQKKIWISRAASRFSRTGKFQLFKQLQFQFQCERNHGPGLALRPQKASESKGGDKESSEGGLRGCEQS